MATGGVESVAGITPRAVGWVTGAVLVGLGTTPRKGLGGLGGRRRRVCV